MAIENKDAQPDSGLQPGAEDYEYLLDDYTHFAPPAEGEVLQGTVLKVTAKDVIVDFGYKSEGLVPVEQFQTRRRAKYSVQVGDVVDVMIDHGEPVEGYVLLSHAKAARLRVWDNLDKAFQEQLIISGHVLGRVKGGLSVDVGREGVHARLAGGSAAGAQPGDVRRAGHSGQGHQAEPAAGQRGGFAQAGRGAGDHRTQERHAGTP